MFTGINKLFENQVSAFPLAVFRITFVFMCLIEAIENTYFRHLIFDFVPYLEPSRISTKPIFFIWIICLLFLLVGFKTRQAAIINYIFTVVVIGHSGIPFGFDWHVDVLLLIGSVLLVLLPVNRYMAVDALLAALKKSSISEEAWENYGQVSFIYKFYLILFVANIYIDSILWKITSPMYLAGLGFWAPASLPYNTYIDLSYILSFENLNRFLGFFVLFFEAFFIVLVMFKRLRPWVCLIGIIFHIVILVAFPLLIFSFFMIT
ncbi:MAG: hypothetical protein KDE51_21175, partial [Anaerolineales bacterium]|nr:hypothetical protein [Anaerolineales bacterium]